MVLNEIMNEPDYRLNENHSTDDYPPAAVPQLALLPVCNDHFPSGKDEALPFLIFDDEDGEDEEDMNEEESFDDMDDDFDDDFDDDEDDFDEEDEDYDEEDEDFDYEEDVDYDDFDE
jgi:hypothetical protein